MGLLKRNNLHVCNVTYVVHVVFKGAMFLIMNFHLVVVCFVLTTPVLCQERC